LFDIHSAIKNTNDRDLVGFDHVECNIPIHNNSSQRGAQFASIRAQKREFAQFVKSPRQSGDDPIGRNRTSFEKLRIDGKKICFSA
jgi:hypothetical protein